MRLKKPLTGERVRLRALTTNDAAQCVEWLSNPLITRYMITRFPPSLEQELTWIRRMNRSKTDFVCAIEVRQPDGTYRHIGNVGLHHIDREDGHAELGIFIGDVRDHGKGIATEAGRLLRAYVFGELNLFKVYARVHEPNFGSRRVCEKLGLTLEGVQKRHVLREGVRLDVCMYTAFRDEQ